MAPLNEAMRLIKVAMNNPQMRQAFKKNVQPYINKLKGDQAKGAAAAGANTANNSSNSNNSQEQWKQYEQYQQSGGANTSGNTSNQQQQKKSFDWKKIQQQAIQFLVVNFMGVMFVFQIFNGVYQSYAKEKKLRDRRREQEARAQEQRGLVVEQMQQTQKLSQQLMASKTAEKKGGGKISEHTTAQLRQQQADLDERIHEASLSAIYQPISGVGVAEVSGFDNSSQYTADIPVQVWIHGNSKNSNGSNNDNGGEGVVIAFDPLVRWAENRERKDRSYDPLTGLYGTEKLVIS